MSASAGQTRVTTHEQIARDRLLGAFRRSPRLRALIQIRARRWQEIEDAAWEVADAVLSVDDSIGVALDNIGSLVGRGRSDDTDPVFRVGLRAQIRINRSGARIGDSIDVLVLSTGGTPHVILYSGGYVIWQDEPLAAGEAEALARNLEQVRPLGMNGRLSSLASASSGRYSSRGAAAIFGTYDSRGAPSAVGSTYTHGRAL